MHCILRERIKYITLLHIRRYTVISHNRTFKLLNFIIDNRITPQSHNTVSSLSVNRVVTNDLHSHPNAVMSSVVVHLLILGDLGQICMFQFLY